MRPRLSTSVPCFRTLQLSLQLSIVRENCGHGQMLCVIALPEIASKHSPDGTASEAIPCKPETEKHESLDAENLQPSSRFLSTAATHELVESTQYQPIAPVTGCELVSRFQAGTGFSDQIRIDPAFLHLRDDHMSKVE